MLIILINVKTGSLRSKSSRASDVPCDSGRAKIGGWQKRKRRGEGDGERNLRSHANIAPRTHGNAC